MIDQDKDTTAAQPTDAHAEAGDVRQTDQIAALLAEARDIRCLLADRDSELLNGKAAARFLGISLSTLSRLASSDPALHPVKVSAGCTRWKRTALKAFVDRLEPMNHYQHGVPTK